MEYKVRNYSEDLFARLLDFYRETVGGIFRATQKGAQFLEMILFRPHFNPERDLFIAEIGNTVAGNLLIFSEFKIKRIVLNSHIHHNFPYRDVALALWGKGLLRCHEIGGDKIHICLPENFRAGRRFFTESGFSPIREHVELRKELKEPIPIGEESGIGQVAHFEEGDEPLLAELQNRIFRRSWGFSPNSAEEIEYYLNLTQCRVSDVLLLKDGEDLIGYLWAHRSLGGDNAHKKGRIHMFGISPEFQGRGLGRKLLRIGLEDMRYKGFRTVDLTVDEANRPAMTLYGSLGFQEKSTSLWYEKTLSPGR